MDWSLPALALATGLFGSGHCIGMCGPLLAAIGMGGRGSRQPGLGCHLLYHLGRITTYGLLGTAAGWLGSALVCIDTLAAASRWLLLLSDLLVIAIGLRSAGLLPGRIPFPARIDCIAASRLIGLFLGRIRHLDPRLAALPLGALMGLLPCGLLYTVLLTAAQSGTVTAGGAILLAFGLGTTPALLLFGAAAGWLGQTARGRLQRAAGLTVALMGAINLARHLALLGHRLDAPIPLSCH